MTVSLRDAEVSPDLSCIQEQVKEVVDQIVLAQVLSGYVLSAIFLNERVSSHRASGDSVNPAHTSTSPDSQQPVLPHPQQL